MVSSLTNVFDKPVTFQDDPFSIVKLKGALPLSFNVTNPSGDGRTDRVTFSGGGVIGGSLADGNYQFRINGAPGARCGDLDPDGANVNRSFHRLFGDGEGDSDVDGVDKVRMQNALGTTIGNPGYAWWLDYDNDGDVDSADAAELAARLGTVLPKITLTGMRNWALEAVSFPIPWNGVPAVPSRGLGEA